MAQEQKIELKLIPVYRRLAFCFCFLANFPLTRRWHSLLSAMAERVLKAGMRYKSDDKWKRVF